jgi:hypothetical protein
VKRGRWPAGLLLIVGLGSAFLGQFYFARRREYVWDGLFFWCVALLSLGLLLRHVRRLEHGRSGWRSLSWPPQCPARTLAAIGGACFALLAGWLARRRPETADYSGPLWLWLIGVVCFLLAFVPSYSVKTSIKGMGPRLRRWLRSRRVELTGMTVLLLVALAVRAAGLEHIPANLGGDEGTWGVEGLAMFDGRLANPFATRWFSFPSMSFLAFGFSMRFFGETVAGLRALPALVGTATVLTTFLLGRELWGRRVAWLAAVALAFGHFHIHFSRLAVNNIADGLFVTLSLWLFVRGLRSRQDVHFALAGAVMGLGWYGYFGARLIGIVAALYLAWRATVEYRFLARYGRLLLILLGAALVVAAPLLLHYLDHPDVLSARARQVSIFASGWLAQERAITGRSAASLLLEQFWKSVSAFHYTLDPTFWYHPSIPLLDFVSGVLFILGLLWATARCHWPANGLLLLWFWLALILGWVMTENPPSSMRLVIVAPALASLVGLGLNWLIELLDFLRVRQPRSTPHALHEWSAVALLIVVAVINLHYYFVVYTPTRVYGNPTAEVATELGRALAQSDDDYVVYFYGPPFIYWDFGTLRFLARGVEGVDVPPPGEGEAPVPDLSRGARFVFLPERLGELEEVRARYPGGVEVPVRSSADGRPLYVVYEISR